MNNPIVARMIAAAKEAGVMFARADECGARIESALDAAVGFIDSNDLSQATKAKNKFISVNAEIDIAANRLRSEIHIVASGAAKSKARAIVDQGHKLIDQQLEFLFSDYNLAPMDFQKSYQ